MGGELPVGFGKKKKKNRKILQVGTRDVIRLITQSAEKLYPKNPRIHPPSFVLIDNWVRAQVKSGLT